MKRKEDLARLLEKLGQCSTDLELWDFMDTHVFKLAQPDTNNKNNRNAFLNIPSANYPDLIFAGMRLLRTVYNDYSGAVSIFERVKQLGAESYVVGCSVSVYNEMIKAKWHGFRDLQKVNELLEEMKINGVNGDHETYGIIDDIRFEIRGWKATKQLMGAASLWSNAATNNQLDKLLGTTREMARGNPAEDLS